MAKTLEVFHVGNGFSALWSFGDADNTRMLVDLNVPESTKEENDADDRLNVIEELEQRIVKTVTANGKKKKFLDILAISHPDEDHLRGIKDLSDKFEIGELWETGLRRENDPDVGQHYKDFVALSEKLNKNGRVRKLRANDKAILSVGETDIHCLFPIERPKGEEIPNDSSCVLRVQSDGLAILFPGDSGYESWKEILKYFEKKTALLRSHILNASHHGSRSFFQDKAEDDPYTDGLRAISPEKILLSSRVPDYSDDLPPHKDALEIYEEKVGAKNLFTTYKCKIIRVEQQEDGSWKIVCGDTREEDEKKKSAPITIGATRRTSDRTFGTSHGLRMVE